MPKAASPKTKASSAGPSDPVQYIYIVTCTDPGPYYEDMDPEQYEDTKTEVLGTYELQAEAIKSAKSFARSEYQDFWDQGEDAPEYPEETHDANGCVSIKASDQEGDEWIVAVTRHVKPPANEPSPKAAQSDAAAAKKKEKGAITGATTEEKTSTPSTTSTAIDHVYLVWKIDNRGWGPTKTEIKRIYKSRFDANDFARSMARGDFPDWFAEDKVYGYESDGLTFNESALEKSKLCKDSNGCIFIGATDIDGDSFEIKVVKQMIH